MKPLLYIPNETELEVWNRVISRPLEDYNYILHSYSKFNVGFDILSFEAYLDVYHGYTPDGPESIEDFCERCFGEEFTNLLRNLVYIPNHLPELENPNPHIKKNGRGWWYCIMQTGDYIWLESRRGRIITLLGCQFGISDPYRNPFGGGGYRLKYDYEITHLPSGLLVKEFSTFKSAKNYLNSTLFKDQFLAFKERQNASKAL